MNDPCEDGDRLVLDISLMLAMPPGICSVESVCKNKHRGEENTTNKPPPVQETPHTAFFDADTFEL
jgi:hypothetical protein